MSALYILIIVSVVVAMAFLAAFIWAVATGQFEDTCTPAMRPLLEDDPPPPARQEISSINTETKHP